MYFNNGTGGNYPYETQTRTVTIEPNNQPNTPSSPSPADGTTGVSTSTSLFWQGGDDPDTGDTVTYDVYFEAGDSTPDVILCDDATTKSCSPGTLNTDTTYYWKVEAIDNKGASTTGPVWSFTTESGGGDPCAGKVPGLVGGYPKIEDNFQYIGDGLDKTLASLITAFYTTGWLEGPKRFADVDISAKTTFSDCISAVETTVERRAKVFDTDDWILLESYLEPLNEVETDLYSGNFAYIETEDWKQYQDEVKEEILEIILKHLRHGNYGIIMKEIQDAIERIVPDFPPYLFLTEVNIIDKFNVDHKKDFEISLPTYLPDPLDKALFAIVESPVDILIIDPQGRMVGTFYNSTTAKEINNISIAFYSGNSSEKEFILIENPIEGNYTIEIVGTGDGSYDFSFISLLNSSVSVKEYSDISILKNEKHIYYLKYGLQEARIYSFMYGTYYSPGETISARIYVENIGGVDIDDELIFTIIDPMGKRIYKKRRPTYLEADEMLSFKFNGDIPSDASKGHYWLRIEFDDMDIDFLPLTERFWVD